MADRHDLSPVEERVTAPSPPTLSTDLTAGTILVKQFRIEEKLGGGGMGTVYRCLDLTVQRLVAIKVLHLHLIGMSKWLLRFQQEARAIARLDHPNIVGVKQMVSQDGLPFIVMDYIKGPNLCEVLSIMGMLAPPRTVKIMSQVADALAHAHENGVVHRDLKPSNIVIVAGSDDVVKILDFGIAKISDSDDSGAVVKLTQTGEVFGSPAYMSPEQVLGKAIDGRSDQYSFGCVLYECLTGAPPFVSTSAVEVMMQHVSDEPVPLSQASLGKEFPFGLERVVKRLLAKNPDDRYQSMLHVKNALQQSISGEPHLVDPEDAVDQRFAPVKEKKFPVVALASFLIGSAVSAVIAYVVVVFSQSARQEISQPMHTPEKIERSLFDGGVNGDTQFRRTVLPNGAYKFDFGKRKLGKISIGKDPAKAKPVWMQETIVVPKGMRIGLEISTRTFVKFPTLLELFRGTNLVYLVIGSEGIDDVVNDSEDDASKNEDTDALQRACVYIQPLKSLELLTFQSVGLNSLGLKYLDLDSFPKLTDLRLSKTPIDGTELAKLKVVKRLCCLDLVGMKNVSSVTRVLQDSKTSTLAYTVQAAGITDADMQPIGKLANLNVLNITRNPHVTARALRYLDKAPLLNVFYASETHVGPDALPFLARMKSLHWISLPKDLWSPSDRSNLRKALPSVDISYE